MPKKLTDKLIGADTYLVLHSNFGSEHPSMFRGFCHSLQTKAIKVYNKTGNLHVNVFLRRVCVTTVAVRKL